jgi:hypothetical protein
MFGNWSDKCSVEISQKVSSAVFMFTGFYKCTHILIPSFILYLKHRILVFMKQKWTLLFETPCS